MGAVHVFFDEIFIPLVGVHQEAKVLVLGVVPMFALEVFEVAPNPEAIHIVGGVIEVDTYEYVGDKGSY